MGMGEYESNVESRGGGAEGIGIRESGWCSTV